MANNKVEIAVSVQSIVKDFSLHHEKSASIKSTIVNLFKQKSTQKRPGEYRALKGVSLEIKKGEFFGIVGRNGSGKSTLLKIIAEIYQPTEGKVIVDGKLVPFIELGVGFNPELTGRENVYLNGALLGFSRKEMEEKYDDIVKFAELEEFMDQQLKNYSSGMQVRLAFSVAIRADADILLIDEVLAVGDEAFQRKCLSYFAQLKKDKKTVIFVTHSMEAIQQFCDRVALIDKGYGMKLGSPLDISQLYRRLNNEDSVTVDAGEGDVGTSSISVSARATVEEDAIKIDVELSPKENLEDPIVAIEIYKDSGEQVYRWTTDEKIKNQFELKPRSKNNLHVEIQNVFPVGVFSVRLLVKKRDRSVDYGVFNDIVHFDIRNNSPYQHDTLWKPNESYSFK